MSIQTVTVHAFEQEICWLFDVVNEYIDHSGHRLSAHHVRAPRSGRRIGNWTVPFYYGGDLRMLYEFARGERDATRDFVDDTIGEVLNLLFRSPVERARNIPVTPDWAFLKSRTLGVILLAAQARARLNDGVWISFDQLAALTGLRKSRLSRLGIETRDTDGIGIECEPKSVSEVLQRLEQGED